MRSHLLRIGALLVILSGALFAQAPRPIVSFDAIPRPPVPADPLELATGAAQPIQDAQQRIAALSMLNKARTLSDVRGHPYDLTTSFVASGGLSSDGNWMLEDMAVGKAYRWTAQGPNYSAINLYPDTTANGLYGNVPGSLIPLRLTQVRAAIFFNYPSPGPQASVRTVTGFLNGAEQRCLLIVVGAGARSFTGARNWEEAEYCIDAKTGLLTTYSIAPGIFVHYDYSSGIQFHGKSIPTAFRITEAGRTVVEARTIRVAEPPDAKASLFNPAGLAPIGVGRAMNPPMNIRMRLPVPGQPVQSNADATIQVVVVHGSTGPDGHLIDVEILASSDPSLNQIALERVSMMGQRSPGQPGAAEQSQERLFTIEFVTPNR